MKDKQKIELGKFVKHLAFDHFFIAGKLTYIEISNNILNKIQDLNDQYGGDKETDKNNQLLSKHNAICSRMTEGRNYLMQINPEEITVEDTLEAFGFNRNGLG